MEKLLWSGPFRFGDWIQAIIAYRHPGDDQSPAWPPSRQGVYAVTAASWIKEPFCLPAPDLLYVGSGRNVLQRVGQLVQDLLGFCGPSEDGGRYAGSHEGGENLWCYCNQTNDIYKSLNTKKIRTQDLYIGWAVTLNPCHTCTEAVLLMHHKGILNKKNKPGTKCCCPTIPQVEL